ncbi:MAG: UDP-N-acetylmuramoyl-tripeptide--D-alanyl-D-alanine ligase, partial [Sciscionella sp.]|nr:UDP-N-acetylmuramoyl-tripeptide--D-alanyl-D-alanine ligase [Sciscionella sp.]
QVAQWLSAAKPVSGRRMEVASTAEGVTVINDSYNANPESMGAALHALAAMAKRSDQIRSARRAIAVLGVMGELGAQSDAAHAEIGRLAVRLGVDELVVIGPADGESAAIARGASEQGAGGLSVIVPDVDAAIAHVRGRLRAGDVVLVKASKVAGLWRVADALLASAGGNGGAR